MLRLPIASLFVAFILAACSDTQRQDNEGTGRARDWLCFGDSQSCDCFPVDDSSWAASSRPEVNRCESYACCLFTDNGRDPMDAECACFIGGGECSAEAASRPGSTIVNQCPPEAEDHAPPTAYAQEGENCTAQYIFNEDLEGCAPRTVCKPNGAGVSVCQRASQQELDWWATCEAAADSHQLRNLSILTPEVATDQGNYTFPDAGYVFAGVGPGGCLNDISFTAEIDGTPSCSMFFQASVQGGAFVTTRVSLNLDACPENTLEFAYFLENNPTDFTVTPSFEGLICGPTYSVATKCLTGNFEFRMQGTVNGITAIAFEEQIFRAEGTVCGLTQGGECPSASQ